MIVQDGTNTGPMSIIQGGLKQALSTPVYDYLGSPQPTIIPDAEYTAIPTGLQYFPNGMIVQDGTNTGPMSIIQGGLKQALSTPVYDYLGSPQPTIIPDAEYTAIPTGLQYFPNGMIVQDGTSTGAMSIIQGGLKQELCAFWSTNTSGARSRPSFPTINIAPFPPVCSTTPTTCSWRTPRRDK